MKQRVVDYCARENITVLPEDVNVDQDYLINTSGGLVLRASQITAGYDREFLIAGVPFLPVAGTHLTATAIFRNLY